MERVYYIDHVSNDDINALSLKLNSMQEVSHIKKQERKNRKSYRRNGKHLSGNFLKRSNNVLR